MTEFINIPMFYHTGESNRVDSLREELGIEVKQSIEDYEVRITRVNKAMVSYYSPTVFLDCEVCIICVDGLEFYAVMTVDKLDSIMLTSSIANKPDTEPKTKFWQSIKTWGLNAATKIATKLATRNTMKTLASLIICTGLHAQGDCPGICVTAGSTYTAVDGSTPELTAANRGCLSAGEATSSFWFRITFTSNGVFYMNIVPAGNKNDFDFAIWSGSSCPPTVPPIRCSWAGIFPFGGAANSPTGLAGGNVDTSEGAAGNGFLAPLNVVNGQTIIININNYGNGSDDFVVSYTGTTATMFCGTPLGDELTMSVTSSLCGYDIVNSDGTYVEVSYNMTDFYPVNGSRLETTESQAFFRLMSLNADGEQVAVSYAYCELDCNVFVVSTTDLQGRSVDIDYIGVRIVTYSDGSVRVVI